MKDRTKGHSGHAPPSRSATGPSPGKRTSIQSRYANVHAPVQRRDNPLTAVKGAEPLTTDDLRDMTTFAFTAGAQGLPPEAIGMDPTTSNAESKPGADPTNSTFDRATQGAGSEVPFRQGMEKRFGTSFAEVQSFTGKSELRAQGANAAAKDNKVAFVSNNPSMSQVAHELTHVVQQQQSGVVGEAASRDVSDVGDAAELEADSVAASFTKHGLAGPPITVSATPTARLHLDRSPDKDEENDDDDDEFPNVKADPNWLTSTQLERTNRLPQRRQLTKKNVYGAANKRQSDAKRRLALQQAAYRRITRKSLKKRWVEAKKSFKLQVRLAPDPGLTEIFTYGMNRKFFHEWEAGPVAHLYGVQKKALARFHARQRKYAADKRRAAFVNQAKGVKFNVTSQAFQQVLIAPVITAVDVAMLVKALSDPKNGKQVLGAILTLRLRTKARARQLATRGATRAHAHAEAKIRQIDKAITRSNKAADAARIEHRAAWAELGRVIRGKPLTLPHGGPFSDPAFYKAAFRAAVASVRHGKTSVAAFVARINKKLAAKRWPTLTAEGERQATQLLDLAKKDGRAPRLPQDGKWSGMPGESTFVPREASKLPHPKNKKVVDLRPGEGVPFKGGRPDFSKHAVDEFDVPGLTGNRNTPGMKRDSDLMELAVAVRYNLLGARGKPTALEGRKYLRRLGLVPHHAGGTKVQLVPHGIHGQSKVRPGIPHTGGASELRGKQ